MLLRCFDDRLELGEWRKCEVAGGSEDVQGGEKEAGKRGREVQ